MLKLPYELLWRRLKSQLALEQMLVFRDWGYTVNVLEGIEFARMLVMQCRVSGTCNEEPFKN